MEISVIQNKIYELRGFKIMLDFDLAEIYEVETKRLKEAVRRNIRRFPVDFMFELNKNEYDSLRTQIATLKSSQRGKHSKYMPFAFTEHGIAMLSGVLNSDKALDMNIAIMRAFIALKQFALNYDKLAKEINELKEIAGSHNIQLNQIYDALENLMEEKVAVKKWEDRERIGFKSNK